MPTSILVRSGSQPRAFGRLPDRHDVRDTITHAPTARMVASLPSKTDNRTLASELPIKDQKALGSCTAQAAAHIMEYLKMKTGIHGDEPHELAPAPVSRLFIYWNTRWIEGGARQTKIDSGAQIRDAIKALAKYGAPPEALMPYFISKFTQRPTDAVYGEGQHDLAIDYSRIDGATGAASLQGIKASLAKGNLVDFGISVFPQIQSASAEKTGHIETPTKKVLAAGEIGGHSLVFWDYDDSAGRLYGPNWWGQSWGDDGTFSIDYEYITNPRLASDFWNVCGSRDAYRAKTQRAAAPTL